MTPVPKYRQEATLFVHDPHSREMRAVTVKEVRVRSGVEPDVVYRLVRPAWNAPTPGVLSAQPLATVQPSVTVERDRHGWPTVVFRKSAAMGDTLASAYLESVSEAQKRRLRERRRG